MRFISLFFWLSLSYATCHPGIDAHKRQFIIGYGSLMFEPSKKTTITYSGKNIAIELKGFKRSWCMPGKFLNRPTTFLGVRPSKAGKFNAALFEVYTLQAIKNLDERERGYCRQWVAAAQIKFIRSQAIKNAQYWIYVPKKSLLHQANSAFPMSEYYADIFISGCRAMEEEQHIQGFTRHCVESTADWPKDHDGYYPKKTLGIIKHISTRF